MDVTPESLLLEAAREAVRTPRTRLALVLHMSRLTPPAPRRYHRRIAHAVLKDTAGRYGGSLFLLRSSDAVLLCCQAGTALPPDTSVADPAALPSLLARLFEADLPAGAQGLTTTWMLEQDGEALLRYAAAAGQEYAPAAGDPTPCAAVCAT